MSVAKVIEICSSSEKSFEDAIRSGIERASKAVEDIEGAWIKEQKVVVEGGQIQEFHVTTKITFILHE
jgi:hypothetical protein